ncbi:hypothetical protein WICPIJ_005471, partial [Wickerhamomyces pijperi]
SLNFTNNTQGKLYQQHKANFTNQHKANFTNQHKANFTNQHKANFTNNNMGEPSTSQAINANSSRDFWKNFHYSGPTSSSSPVSKSSGPSRINPTIQPLFIKNKAIEEQKSRVYNVHFTINNSETNDSPLKVAEQQIFATMKDKVNQEIKRLEQVLNGVLGHDDINYPQVIHFNTHIEEIKKNHLNLLTDAILFLGLTALEFRIVSTLGTSVEKMAHSLKTPLIFEEFTFNMNRTPVLAHIDIDSSQYYHTLIMKNTEAWLLNQGFENSKGTQFNVVPYFPEPINRDTVLVVQLANKRNAFLESPYKLIQILMRDIPHEIISSKVPNIEETLGISTSTASMTQFLIKIKSPLSSETLLPPPTIMASETLALSPSQQEFYRHNLHLKIVTKIKQCNYCYRNHDNRKCTILCQRCQLHGHLKDNCRTSPATLAKLKSKYPARFRQDSTDESYNVTDKQANPRAHSSEPSAPAGSVKSIKTKKAKLSNGKIGKHPALKKSLAHILEEEDVEIFLEQTASEQNTEITLPQIVPPTVQAEAPLTPEPQDVDMSDSVENPAGNKPESHDLGNINNGETPEPNSIESETNGEALPSLSIPPNCVENFRNTERVLTVPSDPQGSPFGLMGAANGDFNGMQFERTDLNSQVTNEPFRDNNAHIIDSDSEDEDYVPSDDEYEDPDEFEVRNISQHELNLLNRDYETSNFVPGDFPTETAVWTLLLYQSTSNLSIEYYLQQLPQLLQIVTKTASHRHETQILMTQLFYLLELPHNRLRQVSHPVSQSARSMSKEPSSFTLPK